MAPSVESLTLDILKRVSIEVLARHLVQGFITGLHRSPLHGFSSTFSENREYVPGDPLKYINWKTYARLHKLYVKRFEDETNMRVLFLFDVSSSMEFPHLNRFPFSKKLYSFVCGGAMAYFLRTQNDAYGLALFGEDIITWLPPSSGSLHNKSFFSILNEYAFKYEEGRGTGLSVAIDAVASLLPSRSMVIIFTDMFENYEDLTPIRNALIHLHHRKHHAIIFHVVDVPSEINMDGFTEGKRLKDLETSQERDISSITLIEAYRQVMQELLTSIRRMASELNVEYYLADIHAPPSRLLHRFYTSRSAFILS